MPQKQRNPQLSDMTDDEIRQKIRDEIKKTEQIIEEHKVSSGPISPDKAIGRLSRMDAINNKSVTESALRQAEDKLNKLHYVLNKVGEDDFGICVTCKQPIPLKRLLLKPESQRCVNCAK